MKALIVHRYFWPDSPAYALLLRYIARDLAASGIEVSVLSTQPSYKSADVEKKCPKKEYLDGYTVKRIKLFTERNRGKLVKVINMLIYFIRVFVHIVTNRFDVVMIATTPPVVGGVAVRLATKLTGSKYIYHCQDIHPEVAGLSGDLNKGFLYKWLRRLDTATCEKAAAVIVLSQDMKNSLQRRGVRNSDNIQIINNFELRAPHGVVPERKNISQLMKNPDRFRILFAGNIGRFQGLSEIIEVAKKLSDQKNIEFVFLGEGMMVQELADQSGDLLNKTVFFYGHQSVDEARRLIADADLCLISLQSQVIDYAYPSKTMTYLCSGAPLLAVVEQGSSLAKEVIEHGLGYTIDPGDVEGISRLILQAESEKSKLLEMRKKVIQYANKTYSVESVLPKWVELYHSLESNDCIKELHEA